MTKNTTKNEVFKLKISEIKVNEANPRLIKDHKFEKLVKSVKEFPEMLKLRPIVVNDENVVLGGNMRLRACIAAGMEEVWVMNAGHLTTEQQNEFIIKDNVGFGEWDWDILTNEWNTTELGEWGLDLWDPAEASDLKDFFEDTPEPEEKINTKIVLEYTEEDYEKVLDAFAKIGGTKEGIVFKLLGCE